CTGCEPSGESPSIVVTFAPPTADTGRTHERAGAPFTWTVHAPHWAAPQPYFVPLRSRVSRSTQRRGVSGATSTVTVSPLTSNVIGTAPPASRVPEAATGRRARRCGGLQRRNSGYPSHGSAGWGGLGSSLAASPRSPPA